MKCPNCGSSNCGVGLQFHCDDCGVTLDVPPKTPAKPPKITDLPAKPTELDK